MINRDEEIKCLLAAITHCKDGTPDHTTRIVRDISWIDWVAQMANAMAAEWVVAKHLDYDYQPGITWDKSRADVGEHIEVKWSVNPSSALWIQESDRHDRDIAILVTGQLPKMQIVGWMPVSIAKRARYRSTHQNNWNVPQSNLQPIETLIKSNYAHSTI